MRTFIYTYKLYEGPHILKFEFNIVDVGLWSGCTNIVHEKSLMYLDIGIFVYLGLRKKTFTALWTVLAMSRNLLHYKTNNCYLYINWLP